MDEENTTQPLLQDQIEPTGRKIHYPNTLDLRSRPGGTHQPSNDPSTHPANRTRYQGARLKTQSFLTSKLGHYAVLLLVSLDVSCIFADLILELMVCDHPGAGKGYGVAREGLSVASLVFSCAFMAELMGSLWAFGFSYLSHPFPLFDALVILTSFIIDVLLRGGILEEVAALVVVLRLWRVVKIIEELSAGANERLDVLSERVEHLERENEVMKRELGEVRRR